MEAFSSIFRKLVKNQKCILFVGRIMRRDMVFLSLLFIVLQAAPIVSCVYVEIDDNAIVYKVVDGDTFDAFPVGRIRLADIDAPDTFDPGYDDAKSYLSQLVNGKHVYVDVDDDNKMDVYNRLVCVVYVRENSTHLKNVNKAMLESGHASVDNHANEFNPSSWTLYTYYPTTDLPEKTYKELLSAYVQLDYDYSDLQQDYSSLESAYSQLQSQYDNLQSTYDDLKSTNRDLMEEN